MWLGNFFAILVLVISSATVSAQWNDPHGAPRKEIVRYGAFSESPKTLDPAKAYSSNEYAIIAQIYEPPLQYHYLKRPYVLVPLTANNLPEVRQEGATTVYTIRIQPGIYYQLHPAFAKNTRGQWLYHHLTHADLEHISSLSDFKNTGTKELTASDYLYEIKRLASPRVSSPIYSVMSEYILGLRELSKKLNQVDKKKGGFLDLRHYALSGVKLCGRYCYEIHIHGHYPQFLFWLSMPFFAPVPWEADAFYAQSGLVEKNITLDSYPVGTGPYQLIENNPNREIVLKRNPHFHPEYYPLEGEIGDEAEGLLTLAGKQLPFIDRWVLTLDKESIPRWNKFLQGYYDSAGIGAESFDQAIALDASGHPILTAALKEKGIKLHTTVMPSFFYLGFNMLDPIVGGSTPAHLALRQALSIAIDYEEYIAIFLNGRGIPAFSPLPPGIYGHQIGRQGINPIVYDWKQHRAQRKSLEEAKRLLKEAGYPNGIDPNTRRPLVLHFDAMGAGSPDEQAYYHWMRQQLDKLGIRLNVRATHYNRFQDKMRKGAAQLFAWGWHADYPDPENFLFLFYGPNGKVKHGGENAMNYANAEYDLLFERMRAQPNGPERETLIHRMVNLLQQDSPVAFGYYPVQFTLEHSWNGASKPHGIAQNTLKYQSLNIAERREKRLLWNHPFLWPALLVGIAACLLLGPLWWVHRRQDRRPTVRRY